MKSSEKEGKMQKQVRAARTARTNQPVRFDGRVFAGEAVVYPAGTEVQLLGRVFTDYLCRFDGGQETYISTTDLWMAS